MGDIKKSKFMGKKCLKTINLTMSNNNKEKMNRIEYTQRPAA